MEIVVSGDLSLSWRPREGLMVYAKYARAFKYADRWTLSLPYACTDARYERFDEAPPPLELSGGAITSVDLSGEPARRVKTRLHGSTGMINGIPGDPRSWGTTLEVMF